ncbi:hypothetical protein GGR52DRAFT_576885 [Hypoxylon sp. FL1284]|nr:hypothetical protein GGR52DRAFT_576885 [Hypoxylon sp. FL1284]
MRDGQQYYMRAGHTVAVAIALIIVDIIAVGLRFWTRRVQRNPPRADDWLMIPATIVTIGIGIDQLYGVSRKGLGYWTEIPPGYTGSEEDLVTPQIVARAHVEFAYSLMLPVALGCLKTSFLFFYMRVFAIQKRSATYKFLVGFIVFVVVWAVTFFFATLFECRLDFDAIWSSHNDFQRRCTQTVPLVFTLCTTDFVTDVAIMIIPIPLILRLNLSTSKKVGVCSMFLLGGGTLVASLIRFIMMLGSFFRNFDMTSDNILGVTACIYWGMVECGVGVFAACLPTIQHLFRIWVWEPAVSSTKTLFGSRGSQTSQSSEYNKGTLQADQTSEAAYYRVHSRSSCSESPAQLWSAPMRQPVYNPYDGWHGRIGAAV